MNKRGQQQISIWAWVVAIIFGFLLIMSVIAFIPPIQIPLTQQKFYLLSPRNANHVKLILTIIAWFLVQILVIGAYYKLGKYLIEKGTMVFKKVMDLTTDVRRMFK